jgi:hypothetical protein
MSPKHFYIHLIQAFNTFLITFLIVSILQLSYFYYIQYFVATQAHRWLDTTLLELLADWDETKFLAHSSALLIENTSTEQRESSERIFKQLGELLQYHGSSGKILEYGLFLQTTQLQYQAAAHFENGSFFVILTLIKEEQQWKIAQFYYEYAFYPQQKQLGSLRHT